MTMPSQIMVRPQGVLAGNGVVEGNVINTGGRLEARADSPDADPGTLTIVGSLNISSPTAVVSVVLGGTLPGSQHSQIVVGGPATLNGRLEAVVAPGFEFHPGQTFEVIRYQGRGGQFQTVVVPGARVSASYGPNSLILRVVCPADWDTSGLVNSADFFEFLAAFFRNDADFNNDNITDSQDLFDYLGAFFGPCVD